MAKKKADDVLGEQMERLAEKLAKDLADGEDVKKPTADMFGKLTTYFAATRKLNLKAPDEDDDDPTFDNFRDKINGQIPTSGRA